MKQRKSFQRERLVRNSIGIGENHEWPLMVFLVADELRGFRERNDDNRNAAPIEFSFGRCHLAEMILARKSGEMSQEN